MHDTAYELGRAFFDTYVGDRKVSVLELGALNINGGLRDFERPGWSYIGVDKVAGRGVDLVLTENGPLPFQDESFDVLVATSVFEHDEFFWQTFEDLTRLLRPGGFIYLNSPSNGDVHRYPVDCWRFYPEAGVALANWATHKGRPTVLVESFVANRDTSSFNDFVAVFSRGGDPTGWPRTRLYEQVECINVAGHGIDDLLKASCATEDMQLLDSASRRVRALEAELIQSRQLIEQARRIVSVVEGALAGEVHHLIGCLDELSCDRATGWVWAPLAPEQQVRVEVLSGGAVVAEGVADLYRADLQAAGLGDGRHSFIVDLTAAAMPKGATLTLRATLGLSVKVLGETTLPPKRQPEPKMGKTN